MAATASVALEGTGSITVGTDASLCYIVLDERAMVLNVKLSDTAVGGFGIESSSSLAELDHSTWIEVYRRETGANTGSKTIYFNAAGAGKTLHYRVTG
jgi:hypothetical protein